MDPRSVLTIYVDTVRTITLPSDSISTLARPILKAPQILCASSTPYAISVDTSSDSEVTTYDAFRNPVHTLVRSAGASDDQTDVFIASDSDRYLNLYNVKEQRLAKTLVAEFEVGSFTTSSSGDILAAVTNNGVIQLFKAPFSTDLASQSTLSKKPKRPGPARPDATVRLVRPGSSITPVPLVASTVDKSDLIFAWVESGVNVTFDRVRWQAEGSNALAFEGVKDIVRSKSSSLLNSVTANGVHEVGKTYVDDSQAVVAGGATNGPNGESVDVDMDDDQEDEEEASEEESETEVVKNQSNAAASEAESSEVEADEEEEQAEAVQGSDAEMADIDGSVADQEEEPAEPSFGQLLARKHPSPIAVPNTIARADGLKNKELSIPSGLSLATVLTQSLRTNDQNLLESCFHTTDTATVRLTIQRLDSSLAATLLQKLADRLARRPGRYGHLLVWVQWTCVAHGGAIAGRPDVLQKIQSLFHVLQQRSKSLDNLLLLKGKLDMLDAQISLRKQMQAERQSRIGGGGTGNTITANEEDIIYIEGQDNDSSSSDEDAILPPTSSSKSKRITRDKSSTKKPRKSLSKLIPTNTADDESERLGSSEDSDDEDMPLQTNGIPTASEEEEESSSEDEYDQTPYIQKASNKNGGEAIIDDEASEESHPSDLDNSEDDDAEEEDSEDSEMDDFINDEEEESIEEISDDDDDDDDLEEIPVVRKKLKGRA